MSYKTSNYSPSSFQYMVGHIPSNVYELEIGETHIPYGDVFPQLPDNIKEVRISNNIYTKNNTPLITKQMTHKEISNLIKILFPHRKGLTFSIDHFL